MADLMKRYILASDFDQTLSFNDSGYALSEMLGISTEEFERKAAGMAVWRKSLFSTMHLNANLPAAYFGVPAAQVVEVGLEVEI